MDKNDSLPMSTLDLINIVKNNPALVLTFTRFQGEKDVKYRIYNKKTGKKLSNDTIWNEHRLAKEAEYVS